MINTPSALLHRPQTVAGALALLRDIPDARPMAGGQTLVAMINLGYAQPSAIVSLRDIAELRGIQRRPDGGVHIGAMATHASIAAFDGFRDGQALLADAARQIADPAIRNFGTIGGACAHGDSVADWPAALVAADAKLLAASVKGVREIAARDFFLGLMSTALEPDELVVGVVAPPLPGRARYRKLARVEGDYATVSVAVVGHVADGVCRQVAISIGACGPVPTRVSAAESLLVGAPVQRALAERAGALLAAAIDPISDVRGSASYRKRILPALVADTLMEVLGHE